jgi:hypothetical protein
MALLNVEAILGNDFDLGNSNAIHSPPCFRQSQGMVGVGDGRVWDDL